MDPTIFDDCRRARAGQPDFRKALG